MKAHALALVPSPAARPTGARAALLAQAVALETQAAAIRALAETLDVVAPGPAVPQASPELLSRQGIARVLSVSLATVDRLDREGQPFVRVGDAKRYDPAIVLAWHQARTAEEPRPPVPPPSAPRSAPDLAAQPAPVPVAGVRRVSVGGKRGAR